MTYFLEVSERAQSFSRSSTCPSQASRPPTLYSGCRGSTLAGERSVSSLLGHSARIKQQSIHLLSSTSHSRSNINATISVNKANSQENIWLRHNLLQSNPVYKYNLLADINYNVQICLHLSQERNEQNNDWNKQSIICDFPKQCQGYSCIILQMKRYPYYFWYPSNKIPTEQNHPVSIWIISHIKSLITDVNLYNFLKLLLAYSCFSISTDWATHLGDIGPLWWVGNFEDQGKVGWPQSVRVGPVCLNRNVALCSNAHWTHFIGFY